MILVFIICFWVNFKCGKYWLFLLWIVIMFLVEMKLYGLIEVFFVYVKKWVLWGIVM